MDIFLSGDDIGGEFRADGGLSCMDYSFLSGESIPVRWEGFKDSRTNHTVGPSDASKSGRGRGCRGSRFFLNYCTGTPTLKANAREDITSISAELTSVRRGASCVRLVLRADIRIGEPVCARGVDLRRAGGGQRCYYFDEARERTD